MKVQLLFLVALLILSCGDKETEKPATPVVPTSPDFLKGENFFSANKRDSAFYYFNNVTEGSKDKFLKAMAYAYMAFIQKDAGDYFGGQESALSGIQLINKDSAVQLYTLASLYNILARSNLSLKNYDDAIRYFKLSLEIQPDPVQKNIVKNNLAVALRDKGEYSAALGEFLSIQADPKEDKADYARRITNFASLKWKADKQYNPVPDLMNALKIRIDSNDEIGATASYNHLADYYLSKNTDSALLYSRKMYSLAKQTNSAEDQLDALRKLTTLVPTSEFRPLFERFVFLSDSMQNAQNIAKNQFALIRYETEKNKKEILFSGRIYFANVFGYMAAYY
ncbi:hypothetical protein [Ferruginibacter sp.]